VTETVFDILDSGVEFLFGGFILCSFSFLRDKEFVYSRDESQHSAIIPLYMDLSDIVYFVHRSHGSRGYWGDRVIHKNQPNPGPHWEFLLDFFLGVSSMAPVCHDNSSPFFRLWLP